jgi:uncharacterized protein YecA (UPF0149 family)
MRTILASHLFPPAVSPSRTLRHVDGLIDSGWGAWLPFELLDAHAALTGGAAARRQLRQRLAAEPDAEAVERWERFRLVAPSRIDVPASAAELDEAGAYALLVELGLAAGAPPRPVTAEPVELVLTLDDEELRELERIRSARDLGAPAAGAAELPSLGAVFGAGVGRNDPCPCGSGKKFKRCHGA